MKVSMTMTLKSMPRHYQAIINNEGRLDKLVIINITLLIKKYVFF